MIGCAARCALDYLGGFSEVRGAIIAGDYEGELFRILVAKIVKAAYRASGDAQRLRGTNLNGRAVNRPGKDTLDTVDHFFAIISLAGWRHQFPPYRDVNLEHRNATF